MFTGFNTIKKYGVNTSGIPCQYTFLDENFASLYESEKAAGTSSRHLPASPFIACLDYLACLHLPSHNV